MAHPRHGELSRRNALAQERGSDLLSRPPAAQFSPVIHRSPTPEETENAAFNQDKHEAFGFQLKKKNGSITPAEQERLGVLQARMDDFRAQRIERAKAQPNLLEITARNAPGTHGADMEARPNTTGLPDQLKAGVEKLSGHSLDRVKVHYNSSKPAQLQALAYTQGTSIHVAPGQEQHLPHETWHVVQQMQGRVKPTMQAKGVPINDDAGLEKEADLMGARASRLRADPAGQPLPGSQGNFLSAGETVQRVRMEIAWLDPKQINLERLEAVVQAIQEQIASLGEEESRGEVENGWVNMEDIERWRGQLDESMQTLRERDDGGTYTWQEIQTRANPKLEAYRNVVITCGNLRKELNDSLSGYAEFQENARALQDLETTYEDSRKKKVEGKEKKESEKKKVDPPAKTPTAQGPVGLGTKWGKYNNALQWKGQTEFHQNVPMGSETIEKSLRSQNLADAVFHTDKAFWIADPKKYKLASASGKALMKYKFTPKGAKSLMEDYLICGSGDFAEDNEEEWVGETAHPDYTIWKANEVGAYGIGANRLAELQKHLESIEAEDPSGKKISVKPL